MKIDFENGAIVHYDDFCSRSFYDISNNLLTAQFDGMGGISKYAVINKWDFFECYYNQMSVNDKVFDLYSPKKVTMVGRKMVIETETEEAKIKIEQFADDTTNAIFEEFNITAKKGDVKFENVINFGVNMTSYLKNLFNSRFSASNISRLVYGTLGAVIKGHKHNEDRGDFIVMRNRLVENWCLDFAVSKPAFPRETSGMYTNQFSAELYLKEGESGSIKIVVSNGTYKDFSYVDVAKIYEDFDIYKRKADDYINNLPVPECCNTEFLKAYYNKGAMLMGMGDFEGASKTFFKLIKRNPDYYKAYLGIAMSFDKLERYSDAIRYYRKFLGLKQFSEDALFARQRIKDLREYMPSKGHSLELVR